MTDRWMDRAGWGSGPWDNEPDRVEWRAHGFPCLIVRGGTGALCGYVGVPPGHPWHGVNYMSVEADAHGGLTYSELCVEGGHVCHVARPGEPDAVWWVGFDCAHWGDYAPSRGRVYDAGGQGIVGYKDQAYVTAEVEALAVQAKEAK